MPVLETIQQAALASPWPELLNQAGDGVFCLVALPEIESNTPIGYALALDGDQCYIAEIAVHPGHRRTGHGSALLESIVDWTDTDEIRLTVRADDPTARAFYETHDFCVIDRLPGHYDDGADTRDGLLLSKSLEP
jgi:ribosomal protein S18 acetylase RimI-like enzyme